jgi:hypothetical protein
MQSLFVSTRRIVVCAGIVGLAGAHCSTASSDPGSASEGQEVSSTQAGPVHPAASSGLCLDVVGQSTANGAGVQVWSCSGNANQRWTYDGTNLRVYGTKCLDVANGNAANGAKLQIWDCVSGDANQKWTLSGSLLQWTGKGKCMDLTNGAAQNGTPIQTWGCTANDENQSWSFPSSAGSGSSSGSGSGSGSGAGSSSGSSGGGVSSCDPNAWVYLGSNANACDGHVGEACGWTTSNEEQGYTCQTVSWGTGCEANGTVCPGGSGSGGGSSGGSSGSGSGSSSGGSPPPPSAIDYAPYFPTWVWGGSGYAFSGLNDMLKKGGPKEVTIAFVLSNGGCNTTQDIEDNLGDVKAFIAAGGHVKASFGGADGNYVESACGSASALASALEGFVDATGITDLDFDIEQGPMETSAVNAMRGQALKQVQASRGIEVAFTLPCNPPPGGGLDSSGTSVVEGALNAGVTISHVNLMTMDFGDQYGGQALGPVVTGALSDGHGQLLNLVPGISSAAAWKMLGVIPMIGKNDDSEVFSLTDAQTLETFAVQNGIGLVSFWSIDRDQPGSDYNYSSTVQSTDFAFHAILSQVTK